MRGSSHPLKRAGKTGGCGVPAEKRRTTYLSLIHIYYEELLRQFGLWEKRDAFVNELSGGQKQRLFIVLALLPDPKVVFLDELTSGLDTKARRSVWKSLDALKQKGLTIFLSSHFMDEVEVLCDTIAILKDGNFRCV